MDCHTRIEETVTARMDRLYGWKVKPEAVGCDGIVNGFALRRVLPARRRKACLCKRLFTMNRSEK
jgi:hypothetical protein